MLIIARCDCSWLDCSQHGAQLHSRQTEVRRRLRLPPHRVQHADSVQVAANAKSGFFDTRNTKRQLPSMNHRGIVLFVTGFTAACGGGVTNSTVGTEEGGAEAGRNEAASDTPSTDGGAFACGDATCGPSEICLYPAYGCIMFVPPDGGVCPDWTEYSDAASGCVELPPPPSCASPGPGEGSFDCSGGGAYPGCGVVSAPIPNGCSHVCRGICV